MKTPLQASHGDRLRDFIARKWPTAPVSYHIRCRGVLRRWPNPTILALETLRRTQDDGLVLAVAFPSCYRGSISRILRRRVRKVRYVSRCEEWYMTRCSHYSVGPIARIAPNHLITSDPELWTRINAVRSPYKRSSWYYHAARFETGKDNVFTECDNDRHDARRKKMVSGVSQSSACAFRGISICRSRSNMTTADPL